MKSPAFRGGFFVDGDVAYSLEKHLTVGSFPVSNAQILLDNLAARDPERCSNCTRRGCALFCATCARKMSVLEAANREDEAYEAAFNRNHDLERSSRARRALAPTPNAAKAPTKPTPP